MQKTRTNESRLFFVISMFILVLFYLTSVASASNYVSEDSIIRDSTVTNSVINHSVIDTSVIDNSTMLYTNTLGVSLSNITCDYADLKDDLLIDGYCVYGQYTYPGPFNISLIYQKVDPTSVGTISFSKNPVKPGDVVKVYFQKTIDIHVNYSINFGGTVVSGQMYDDGSNGDETANDAIYTAEFTVPSVSSGNYLVTVNFVDTYGNHLQNMKYITVDSQPPVISNANPVGKVNTKVTDINLTTSEDSECRFGMQNVAFGSLPYVMTGTIYHDYLFSNPEGNLTLYVKCQDPAGNIGSYELNYSVDYTSPVLQFVSPSAGATVYKTFIAGLNYVDVNPDYDVSLYIDGLHQSLTQYNTSLLLRFENSVSDSSIYHHSVSGTVGYASGYFGNAADFTGSECLSIPVSSSFNSPSTVAFWFKTSSSSGTIAKYGDTTNGWKIFLNSGALELTVYNAGASTTFNAGTYDDNSWHSVVMYLSSSGTIYIDNKLTASGNMAFGNPSSSLTIGCDGSSDYYSGLLDSFAIFPTELPLPYSTSQDFPMIYFIVNSSTLADGQHTMYFSASDSYNNYAATQTRTFYSNNNAGNLILLNLNLNAHIKNSPYLEYIAPVGTEYVNLSTNCGTIVATTKDWDNVYWDVTGLTKTGCWVNAIAYDHDGHAISTLNVTNIEVDNTPPSVYYSVPNPSNGHFDLNISGSDISYSNVFLNCSSQLYFINTITYPDVARLDLSNFYGSCSLVVDSYDEVGNVNVSSKPIFVDTHAPTLSLDYQGSELQNNQILNGTVTLNVISSDDSMPLSYEFCVDSNCSSSSTTISLNTSKYLQSWHELYVCANDSVGNFGCSKEYLTYFDNLLGKHQLYVFDFYNNSYLYGVKELDIHLPYNTYTLKIFVDGNQIYSGYTNTYFLNTSQFSDGAHVLHLEAYDNLGNLLGQISYNINIYNVVLSAPTLTLYDRYDKDGIINLTWTSVSGASDYYIYRAMDNGTFEYLDKTTLTHYEDFLNEGKFSYYVVAVNPAGKLGTPSNIVYTEVRKHPVVGSFDIARLNVKPLDIETVKYYAYDSRNLTVNLTIVGFQTITLKYEGYTSDGYLYEANFSVPNYNGELPLQLNTYDLFGFTTSQTYYMNVYNISPSVSLSLKSQGSVGFEKFNHSVTAVPMIYYDVNTPASSCLVKEAVLAEEFSKTTMNQNGIVYSGTFYGYPYSSDYIFVGNFSKSLSLDSGMIYTRIDLKDGMNLSFGTASLTYSSGTLKLGDISVSLVSGWYNLIILFNSTKATLYVNGVSYSGSGFTVTSLKGTDVEIDTLILSPGDDFGFNYGSCSGSLYLTTDDGWKTVFALVKDSVGNVNVSTARILLNKSGAQLDVTPPIMGNVYSDRRYQNNGNFSFHWDSATDYEQSLLNIPLTYQYELYKYPNTLESNCSGTTTSTSINCNLSVQNNETYYLKVLAINSAGLKSNYSQSGNVTIDLVPPTDPIISSSTMPQQCPTWSGSDELNLSWHSTDDISGIKDYYFNLYYYNLTAMGLEPLKIFKAQNSTSYYITQDGVLYFYVGARDNADNVGNFSVYKVCVDLTAPTSPKLINFYQIQNTTDLFVSWLASSDIGGSGVDYYNVSLFNASGYYVESKSVPDDGSNEYNTTFSGYLDASKYYVKIRAVDKVGNPSAWSDEFVSSYDRTPPKFIYTTPSGNTTGNDVRLTVKTDEIAVCYYNSSVDPTLTEFLYTNSTYHETVVRLNDSELGQTIKFGIVCVNQVGLVNTTYVTFHYVGSAVTLSSVTISAPSTVVSGSLMTVQVHVDSDGSGLANIPRSWFRLSYNSSVDRENVSDFSLSDFGGGNYNITFNAPTYDKFSVNHDDPNFDLTITVTTNSGSSVSNTAHFTVSELDGVLALNEPSPTSSLKYVTSDVDGLKVGIATDDNSIYSVASPSGNTLQGNLNTGAFYLFVSPKDANIKAVQPLLYNEKFIKTPGVTFSRLSISSKNQLDVIVPFSNESISSPLKLPPGDYKVRITEVGYDKNGNPIYQVNLIN